MYSKNITRFITECKNRGLNVTSPRLLIYKTMLEHSGHPSAEDIYQAVKLEHPSISLATVYKTLELLAKHNLIDKVTHLHDMARYDCNNHFHHHFVCVECKKIIDIDNKEISEISVPKDLEEKYHIISYRVQFDGLCKECQT